MTPDTAARRLAEIERYARESALLAPQFAADGGSMGRVMRLASDVLALLSELATARQERDEAAEKDRALAELVVVRRLLKEVQDDPHSQLPLGLLEQIRAVLEQGGAVST